MYRFPSSGDPLQRDRDDRGVWDGGQSDRGDHHDDPGGWPLVDRATLLARSDQRRDRGERRPRVRDGQPKRVRRARRVRPRSGPSRSPDRGGRSADPRRGAGRVAPGLARGRAARIPARPPARIAPRRGPTGAELAPQERHDHGQQPARPAALPHDRSARGRADARPHHGRERRGQGAGRARAALLRTARDAAVHRDQLRGDPRVRCSRPSCSATSAARSPAR